MKGKLKWLITGLIILSLVVFGFSQIGYFEWVTSTYKVYAGRACYYWTLPG